MNCAHFLTRTLTIAAAVLISGIVQPFNVSAGDITVKPSIAEAGKLRMGNTLSYAPFEFRDANNKPTGIDIELAFTAAKLMGVELEIVEIPFVNSLPALASGRTDISWASYTVREDRLKQVDFVVFMEAGTVAATTPEKAATMKSQNDLCGKKMAIIAGGSADFTADKLSSACEEAGLQPIKKEVFPDVPTTIQAVLSGRVDGKLDDSTASGYFEVTSGGKLVVVPGLYDPMPAGVAVPKGDTEAAEMMRSALQAMIDNGSYQAIFDKYGMGTSTIDEAYIVTSIDELRM
jgi:polar amino acid transport system substrate-binding protein